VEKIVIGNHLATANELAKKAEKAAKNNQKAADKRANSNDDEPEPNPEPVETYPDVKIPPNVPGILGPDMSRQNRRGLRRLGGTTVRNLPDGTQIMTLPDGTRVVTMPNGTKRIFGPGQKLERKRGTP